MTGAWIFLGMTAALWIGAALACWWGLRKHHREIEEHTDAHYRRHNGVSGGSLL